MSRRHCRSARREARPSKLRPLEPRGKHHGCQNRSHTNISSLAHVIGMLPRTYHHCHSTRRGTRPSNCAAARGCIDFSHDAYTSVDIYEREQSNVASSLSQRPSRSATEQTARSRITIGSRLPERSPPLTYFPVFHHLRELPPIASCLGKNVRASAVR